MKSPDRDGSQPPKPGAPSKPPTHRWAFAPRFRARAFGWRSQPAIQRVKEAVAEIRKVARRDPLLAAEGAVRFLEKVSPALQRVDSSSGAIGTAVNHAIVELAAVISQAPADRTTRERWLERLWQAHQDDDIPYIEILADCWGELCASPELASEWADRTKSVVEMMWGPLHRPGGHFHGLPACLSSLLAAGRHEELLTLIEKSPHFWWHDRKFGFRALAAMGRVDEAIAYAEATLAKDERPYAIARACEEVLLQAGRGAEAYGRYALLANQKTTNLATFRAIVKKYPHREKAAILADLIDATPGEAGKWFAAAKDAGFLELAADLVQRSPCDPHTLNRAARDYLERDPAFALKVALASLRWLIGGWGYEISGLDVLQAHHCAMKAAQALGREEEVAARIREMVASDGAAAAFVREVLRM